MANEDSFFYHLQTRQEVRNALASEGVYTYDDMPEFSLKPLSPDELTDLGIPDDVNELIGEGSGVNGFQAMLYQDFITGEDQYVLAFAGTQDLLDWIDNIRQGLGYESEQYNAAMRLGFELTQVDEFQNANLITTGHSLGGGLASAAAVAAAIPGHTFNAAGLHSNSLNDTLYPGSTARYNNAAAFIKAYYVDWDILSLLQDHFVAYIGVPPTETTIDPPEAIGQRIERDGPYDTELLLSAVVTVISAPVGVGSAGFFTVLSHMNDAVLFSLLDEYDVFGYDL